MWKECHKKGCLRIPPKKKDVGKPRNRWLDDAENCRKKIGVTGWRRIAEDRDA
jgi:hypothetical protein